MLDFDKKFLIEEKLDLDECIAMHLQMFETIFKCKASQAFTEQALFS